MFLTICRGLVNWTTKVAYKPECQAGMGYREKAWAPKMGHSKRLAFLRVVLEGLEHFGPPQAKEIESEF